MSEQHKQGLQDPPDAERRRALLLFSVAGGAGAIGSGVAAQTSDAPASPQPPRRALTGRDAAGKSVFRSFDTTPQVINIDANPGLTFYELYATEGIPRLAGTEPDPILRKTQAFPGPGGTNFRLITYPGRRPAGYKPPPGVTYESGMKELDDKVPGMAQYFDKAPGMHATDDRLLRGRARRNDPGARRRQKVNLRQGDCFCQNGTRHRWRNPGTEPCFIAFVSVGGKRGG
jgi:hypothetical protein